MPFNYSTTFKNIITNCFVIFFFHQNPRILLKNPVFLHDKIDRARLYVASPEAYRRLPPRLRRAGRNFKNTIFFS